MVLGGIAIGTISASHQRDEPVEALGHLSRQQF